jgi:hypothetical protein
MWGGGGASDAEVIAATKELRGDPADAEAVLERHGLDRASYEQALFDIAADPARSEAYTEGVGRR